MASAATVRVRPLDELDLTEVVAIVEAAGGGYDPRFWEDRIAAWLRRDPEGALVAVVDDRVAGFMLGEVRRGEFGFSEPTGWIEVLGVDPAQRGKAIGRALAEALFEHFRSAGAAVVRTLVEESRPELVQFFSTLGFESAPIRPLVRRL